MMISSPDTAMPTPTHTDPEPVPRPDTWWTPLGVRMIRARRSPGRWNWLFLPGGPGIGSDSLIELVEAADLPGTSWLVDLPGDGSNVNRPSGPTDPYRLWPDVLLEAVDAVPDPIAVGHSTGGEYVLSVPALQGKLRALVLISSAPDCGWMPTFEAMCAADPLASVTAAASRYDHDPTDANLQALAVASAPWNFTAEALDRGRDLLARMPYNHAATEWSTAHFDHTYVAKWWPTRIPVLIVSGAADRIVDQKLWQAPYYQGPNTIHATIDRAGHFPWIDRPQDANAAFGELLHRLAL